MGSIREKPKSAEEKGLTQSSQRKSAEFAEKRDPSGHVQRRPVGDPRKNKENGEGTLGLCLDPSAASRVPLGYPVGMTVSEMQTQEHSPFATQGRQEWLCHGGRAEDRRLVSTKAEGPKRRPSGTQGKQEAGVANLI
jgi:hypothetical protein